MGALAAVAATAALHLLPTVFFTYCIVTTVWEHYDSHISKRVKEVQKDTTTRGDLAFAFVSTVYLGLTAVIFGLPLQQWLVWPEL